ncbi:predicted protein [Naegleria gruberi]|uniref:Predicted protein n=1 Tax=Naegleria gruberi TaxID=5762 RepID=D2VKI7_NAEGR|nr:uncharacterized protein NAEGRDRAFT_69407 [Naegleria gruberi]EFC42698.1 predicted protein [Naegleria gruberi]|eukprot:XP_002675442.1 predicted protein [Naegleria gruberi strain NEG-M]
MYCQLGELVGFSQANSAHLKILFNQEPREKKIEKPVNDESVDFHYVQTHIWKPLVCFYFPRFEKALNIKNWMHVLRRRKAHIKIHGNDFRIPSETWNDEDKSLSNISFIENCEYIYKCPLQFSMLEDTWSNESFCKECKKTVYNVQDVETFKDYSSKGYCVSLGYDQFKEGEMCYFDD